MQKTVVSTDKPISKGYQARSSGAERSEKTMSEYAILRFAKLPKNGNVAGSVRHITRERDTPNADPQLRDQNSIEGGQNVSEIMGQFRNRLPDKVRKNGVRAIECLVTASPEKINSLTRQEQDAYFEDAKKWIGEKFGGEDNIFCTAVHRDEKTPHMHVLLVPMAECEKKGKKLAAAHYLDGSEKLRALQTGFAQEVGEKHGLQRGIEGSKAKHQTIQRYYAQLNDTKKTVYQLREPQQYQESKEGKGLLGKAITSVKNKIYRPENDREVADRLASHAANVQRELEQKERTIERAKKTLQNLDSQLKQLQPFRDLSRLEREQLARDVKKKKEREAATKKDQRSKRSKGFDITD